MLVKKVSKLIVLLLAISLLVGCIGGGIVITDPDEIEIYAIADSIETALKNKDVDVFMSNISPDYSDSTGGDYDSMYTMAENMVSKIEEAEETAASYGANLTVDTSISNLVIINSTATSGLKITIKAKFLIFTFYSYNVNFEVIYQKEGDDWKIISMVEI